MKRRTFSFRLGGYFVGELQPECEGRNFGRKNRCRKAIVLKQKSGKLQTKETLSLQICVARKKLPHHSGSDAPLGRKGCAYWKEEIRSKCNCKYKVCGIIISILKLSVGITCFQENWENFFHSLTVYFIIVAKHRNALFQENLAYKSDFQKQIIQRK